jgi:hypothetical protein
MRPRAKDGSSGYRDAYKQNAIPCRFPLQCVRSGFRVVASLVSRSFSASSMRAHVETVSAIIGTRYSSWTIRVLLFVTCGERSFVH